MATPNLAAIRDWCLSKFQPKGNYAAASDIPVKTSDLLNDSGYMSQVPIASGTVLGGVKPDGTTITIDVDGTIHAVSSQELAESVLGGKS